MHIKHGSFSFEGSDAGSVCKLFVDDLRYVPYFNNGSRCPQVLKELINVRGYMFMMWACS